MLKSRQYYGRARIWPSLLGMVQDTNVLDIGCGTGKLGEYLKKEFKCNVVGIEIEEMNIAEAALNIDTVYLGDIESFNIERIDSRFDYIIFSDSLEHLNDPWSVIIRIKKLLSPGGKLLIAIPNVRCFRVTLPLIFADSWEYKDEGLLDKTHLRFFTLTSVTSLLKECGFYIEDIQFELPLSSKVGKLNLATLGVLKRHLSSHYYIKAAM